MWSDDVASGTQRKNGALMALERRKPVYAIALLLFAFLAGCSDSAVNVQNNIAVTVRCKPPVDFQELHGGWCGQYSIATVLTTFGKRVDYQEIFAATNPDGTQTLALPMIKYLDPLVGATAQNKSSIDALREHLEKGFPAIVLLSGLGDPHWVVVRGFSESPGAEIRSWQVVDQLFCNTKDMFCVFEHDVFMHRWKYPNPLKPQFSCYWIAVGI